MKLNSRILAVIILVLFFSGIGLSAALGNWNTEGGGGSGEGQVSALDGGEEAALMVRGKTTFQDLLDLGVPPERIEAVIGAPLPAPALLVKDYCTANGLEFGTIKEALQIELDAIAP